MGCLKDYLKTIDSMKYIKFWGDAERNKFLFNNIAIGDMLFCSDASDRYIHTRILVIGIEKDNATGIVYLTEFILESNSISTTKVSYNWDGVKLVLHNDRD